MKIIFDILKSILPPAIYSIMSKIIGAFMPTKSTPDNVASLPQLYKANTRPTKKHEVQINEKIRATYKDHKYKWQPEKDILLLQDFGGQFNDITVIWENDKPYKYICTGEGGDKKKGYWRSRFLVAQHLDLYSIGKGYFPRSGKYKNAKMKYFRQNYAIDFFNLETGKVKKAIDCLIHGVLGNRIGKRIRYASQGCQVLAAGKKAIMSMVKVYENKDDTKFNHTTMMLHDCQEWVHEIPLYRNKKR